MIFKHLISSSEEIKEIELREVCQILNGTNFKPTYERTIKKPFIKVKDIQDGNIYTNELSYFDPSVYTNCNSLKFGDIVMVRTGRGSVGKVGINLSDEELFFDGFILKLEPNPEVLNKRYLYHYLLSCPDRINQYVVEGVIHNLSKTEFSKMKIPVPSLKVQVEIAEKLDKFREIEREISLRTKQYEYYRNFLMNGDSH